MDFFQKVLNPKKVHIIGIGGIGMSAIAHLLLDWNIKVSGSDIKENESVKVLKERGAEIHIPHSPANVKPDSDLVIYSSAIKEDNPELLQAKKLGIITLSRKEFLKIFTQKFKTIAISGSHGKTTTTSLLIAIFEYAGLFPSFIVGGKLPFLNNRNGRLGKGNWLILEADESDKTFIEINPTITVTTSLDKEHLEAYTSFEDLQNSFRKFITQAKEFAVINNDDVYLNQIKKSLPLEKIITCGIEKPAVYSARNIQVLRKTEGKNKLLSYHTSFEVYHKDKKIGKIDVPLLGIHNVYNSLLAITTALELGINFQQIKEALRNFKNAKRRLEFLKKIGNILFYDDYAHHPREIEATLKTLKENFPNEKILFILEPHRYTRLKELWQEFVKVLSSHKGVITPIYSAGEKPLEGISAKKLAEESGNYFAENEEEIKKIILSEKPTIVVFMGAGRIYEISKKVLNLIGS